MRRWIHFGHDLCRQFRSVPLPVANIFSDGGWWREGGNHTQFTVPVIDVVRFNLCQTRGLGIYIYMYACLAPKVIHETVRASVSDCILNILKYTYVKSYFFGGGGRGGRRLWRGAAIAQMSVVVFLSVQIK